MATKKTVDNVENEITTGLDLASDKQEAEYDLLSSLLEAADYKTSEDEITKVNIVREKKFLFAVRIRPLGEEELRVARKKATTYMPNPNGKKLPPIEKEFDNGKFKSWLIYLATIEEDKQKIWGQSTIMQKFGLMEAWESVDVLLKAGEKNRLMEEVYSISGFDEEENTDEVSF